MVRLDKYLAESGIASRREVKAMIESKLIKVNGKLPNSAGDKINPSVDKIKVKQLASNNKTTIAVYKPRGVACTKDKDSGKTVFDVFKKFKHLNTVGRLDKESEGLLLLSNDGLVTKAITDKTHPSEKEYIVTVREDVLPWTTKKMSQGIRLENKYVTKPCKVEKINRNQFSIILKEGKKHQIRQMANAVGLTITELKRIRINNIYLGKARPGQHRTLSLEEISDLKKLISR